MEYIIEFLLGVVFETGTDIRKINRYRNGSDIYEFPYLDYSLLR